MPEPTNPNPNPGGSNPPTPPVEPTKPTGDTNPVIDVSKLSDEQLNKVLEDPRLWKTPRLSELTEAQKKVKQYETEKAQREQDELKKKGDFETLSKQQEEKLQGWQDKYNTAMADNAIMAEAAKVGIKDLDAAKKLIDRANIKVNEDGTISGVADAVAALVQSKSYLVNGNTTSIGGGTNPPNPNTPSKFKLSQLQDPKFYNEHRAEIQKAMATPGAIEDDLAPMSGQ